MWNHFLTALLRYNWRAINSARLKYKIKYVYAHEAITVIMILNISITPKITSSPFTISPSLAHSNDHWFTVFHYKRSFLESYINGITKCLLFFAFPPYSTTIFRFQHVACMSTLFLWQSSTHLYGYATGFFFPIHLLMDIWIDSRLELLQIKLLWTFMY